jgi:hypothetical protein
MDTGISYCGGEYLWFYSDERRWHTRIKELAEKYPEQCVIKQAPETNDGCITAKLPVSWLKIAPKRACNLTDEQRATLAERLRTARKTPAQPLK